MRSVLPAACATFLLVTTPSSARDIFLDKLDPKLDSLWNYLDRECRGGSGNEAATDAACDQRLTVDTIIKSKGCRNVYPALAPATSYWLCRR
jgi:hypothetical protein